MNERAITIGSLVTEGILKEAKLAVGTDMVERVGLVVRERSEERGESERANRPLK